MVGQPEESNLVPGSTAAEYGEAGRFACCRGCAAWLQVRHSFMPSLSPLNYLSAIRARLCVHVHA